jgi:hypothetical protein
MFELYRVLFSKFDAFTALSFTGTGAPLAAKHMRIMPITFGMKGGLFTDHRRR